jgi:hypothetical protein
MNVLVLYLSPIASQFRTFYGASDLVYGRASECRNERFLEGTGAVARWGVSDVLLK